MSVGIEHSKCCWWCMSVPVAGLSHCCFSFSALIHFKYILPYWLSQVRYFKYVLTWPCQIPAFTWTCMVLSNRSFGETRRNHHAILCYRSRVSFWPMEFSSGRLGASHRYSSGDSGLADETKQIPSPRYRMYRIGPFASCAVFFAVLELTDVLYKAVSAREINFPLIGMERSLILDQVKSCLLSWTVLCGYNITTLWTNLRILAFKMDTHVGRTVLSVEDGCCVSPRVRWSVEAE
jgi:hypothetical protein